MPNRPPPYGRGPPPPNLPPPQMRPMHPGQQPPPGVVPPIHAPPPPFPIQQLPQPPLATNPPTAFRPGQASPQHAQFRQPPQATPTTTSYPAYSSVPGAVVAPATAGALQQTASAATVAAAAPTKSKEIIDQSWKEYTSPSGVKYYYNDITKESTYTKPQALVAKEAATTASSQPQRQWKEYEHAATGKKYYSDGVTTTWEKPAGFKSEDDQIAEASAEPPQKKKKAAPKKETEFANKEEAVAAFKGLLLAKGIVPTAKWNEVARNCSSDSRWEACEDVLTVGERRQALAEYQTKRANELKTLERQERIRAKDAFGQLLTDTLPKVSNFSAWNSRFSDVRAALSKDDRFYAVEDEGTRENLFIDFCEEYRKREERKKRNKKREAQDALVSFFAEKHEGGSLTFASTWYVSFVEAMCIPQMLKD